MDTPTEAIIVVHGGAWDIPKAWREATVAACRAGAEAGLAILAAGGTALLAVHAAIRELEDHPVLSAGIGAARDAEGHIALDAALMRGADLAAGAVAAVPPTRHPIDLAHAVLEHSPHVLLVGPRALEWGAQLGIHPCPESDLYPPPHLDRRGDLGKLKADTVGAVALDSRGGLATGTSTGGTPNRHPARVGDSPLIGAGCYADDTKGAASATGTGEVIIRTTLSRAAVDALVAGHHPSAAAKLSVDEMMGRTKGTGGIILLDPLGRVGMAHTTPAMCWAVQSAKGAAADWRVRQDSWP